MITYTYLHSRIFKFLEVNWTQPKSKKKKKQEWKHFSILGAFTRLGSHLHRLAFNRVDEEMSLFDKLREG